MAATAAILDLLAVSASAGQESGTDHYLTPGSPQTDKGIN